MKFDPASGLLTTDSGRPIKRMGCPYHLRREDMADGLVCRRCHHTLIDAHSLPEGDLLYDEESDRRFAIG